MVDPTRRLPPALVATAREYAEGRREPVEPRFASTVVLLRAGRAAEPGGLELYLLRRHVGMEFAAGMSVFPGGGVDKRDFDGEVGWAGPPPAEWARRLGVDEATARALVCAAVRETFEESGVLLAGPSADEVVADTTGADWEADRVALEGSGLSFTEFLAARGLVIRTDLLGVTTGWQTPVFEPRRYRTWFFVAELPEGQRTRDVSTESDGVAWWTLRDAITAVDAGEMLMLPPTYSTCLELYDARTPHEALLASQGPVTEMIEPQVVFDGDSAYLTVPDRLVALRAEVAQRMAERLRS